jgi:HSP20 family protein
MRLLFFGIVVSMIVGIATGRVPGTTGNHLKIVVFKQTSGAEQMPVFRWGHAWDAFQDLEREVDQLLQGVNLSLHGVRSARRFPLMNLIEKPDHFLLTAEIPGVDISDLEVTAADGRLTIKGVRRSPEEARDDTFRRQERFQGNWQRTIQLPDRVEEDGFKAEYSAGVLRIMLAKAASSVARDIPVTEGPE